MQIHNLPAQVSAADTDLLAIDNGSTTQKITAENLGKKITEDAKPAFITNDAADSEVTENTAWLAVAKLTSGETMKSILNKVSSMFKNVRRHEKQISKLNTDLSSKTDMLSLTKLYGDPSTPIDIDNIKEPNGYVIRVINGTGFSGTWSSLFSSNAVMIMGFSEISSAKLLYGVQIAITFGAKKLFIRNALYNASGTTWSDWAEV